MATKQLTLHRSRAPCDKRLDWCPDNINRCKAAHDGSHHCVPPDTEACITPTKCYYSWQTCVNGYCANGEEGKCSVSPNFGCEEKGQGSCCDEWASRWNEIIYEAQRKADAAGIPANYIDCNGSYFTVDLTGSDGSQCSSTVGLAVPMPSSSRSLQRAATKDSSSSGV
jgi:hypothetical protein